jgi:hypothetical protein
LSTAPTVIAPAAQPGERIVPGSGPEFAGRDADKYSFRAQRIDFARERIARIARPAERQVEDVDLLPARPGKRGQHGVLGTPANRERFRDHERRSRRHTPKDRARTGDDPGHVRPVTDVIVGSRLGEVPIGDDAIREVRVAIGAGVDDPHAYPVALDPGSPDRRHVSQGNAPVQ